jgi:hypothetical protein
MPSDGFRSFERSQANRDEESANPWKPPQQTNLCRYATGGILRSGKINVKRFAQVLEKNIQIRLLSLKTMVKQNTYSSQSILLGRYDPSSDRETDWRVLRHRC